MGRFIYAVFIGLYCLPTNLLAMEGKARDIATLSFSDNRQSLTDFSAINGTLKTVGVHLSRVDLPSEALPILKFSATSKLNEEQKSNLLKIFSLTRKNLLDQISIAGRKPVISGGGRLSTGEVGVAPYPKIYVKFPKFILNINMILRTHCLHVVNFWIGSDSHFTGRQATAT